MDHPNRINQTSISQTTQRQTPQNDFGQVLARTISGAVKVGTGVAGGLTAGNPVLSAAVSSVSSAVSAIIPVGSSNGIGTVAGASGAGGAAGVGGAEGAGGQGNEWDLLEAQKLMRSEERQFNLAYLDLQNAMQKESREFNAISNIMKVRHDSAKAAINNIR